jgi:two-component system, chemotaxis family, response regulator PixH
VPAPLSNTFVPRVSTLVVERDADARETYAGFLRQCGCEVEEAQDGREALAKAFSRRPHVIVTATRLPGMSGFDLCRLLRTDTVTSSIPIVVVTSDTATEGRRALSAGADSVISNAASPDVLFSEIQQLLIRTRTLVAESRAARAESEHNRAETRRLLERANLGSKRVMLNHVHGRHVTTDPSAQPPALVCPNCYEPLKYLKSYIGGVSARHPEQWDYFECRTGCGTYQYRHRTRKLRQIA